MACLVLDGKQYDLDEPMEDHVSGRCSLLPRTVSYRELGIDVDDPDFKRELASDWFQRQDEATQRKMMGTLYDPWKAGDFKLEDIPKQVKDKTWGNSWVPKSLKELVGDGKAQAAR